MRRTVTMPQETLAFVDVETNGGSITKNRIIEIGIVRVMDGSVVDTFNSLINPNQYIPPFITGITGINNEVVADAPSFDAVREEIYAMLEGCLFVAHNARFDYGFIRNEFKRTDYQYNAQVLCTARLSQLLFPYEKKHNLDSIIERFGITCKNRHRAFDDANVLWEFYKKLPEHISPDKLYASLAQVTKTPTLPVNLPPGALDNLPEEAGIYEFYGTGDVPLYIGKSTNIRTRVLSHFSGDYLRDAEMDIARQTKHISFVTTSGDLGARLLEARLIQEKKPVYNKKLRTGTMHTIISEDLTADGYKRAVITEVPTITDEMIPTLLKVCKSRIQAQNTLVKIAEQHGICRMLLGIEKTTGSCFAYKMSRCSGACVGQEDVALFNRTFDRAFEDKRIQPWPFTGSIEVREGDTIYLFNNWCLLASYRDIDRPQELETSYTADFNYDVYKILRGYLYKKLERMSKRTS
ncbi:MAG: exonuclease domain-containing protein [Patescibacteria group bacterium]